MAALADTPTISASSSSAAAAAAVAAVTANGSAMGTAMHEEFKREAHEELGGMGNGLFPADLLASPKIRLTPTIKLMPSPNATDPKRKFICPYEHCTKSYGKSSHLRSHLTWHTGVKPFVCHEAGCGKGFTRSDELNRHVRTHTGEKPFECLQCGKKFSRSDHLTKHLATHAKQMQNPGKKTRFTQPQVATANGAASRWAEELVERKPQITAQQALFNAGCHTPDGIDFNDGMHFMAALMSSAKAHPVARDAYGEPENLAYNGHALDHAPIKIKLERPERGSDYHVVHDSVAAAAAAEETEDDEDDDQGPMIKVVSTMVCPSSPPERKFSAAAAAHNSDDDYDDPEDDAIMPEANVVLPPPPPRVVSVPSKPPQPVLTGDPERPYGCNQCEKSFKRQDDLSRHMRTHSGEKPYECGECHKRFMRSDHLKKHQKTHNKAR